MALAVLHGHRRGLLLQRERTDNEKAMERSLIPPCSWYVPLVYMEKVQ